MDAEIQQISKGRSYLLNPYQTASKNHHPTDFIPIKKSKISQRYSQRYAYIYTPYIAHQMFLWKIMLSIKIFIDRKTQRAQKDIFLFSDTNFTIAIGMTKILPKRRCIKLMMTETLRKFKGEKRNFLLRFVSSHLFQVKIFFSSLCMNTLL